MTTLLFAAHLSALESLHLPLKLDESDCRHNKQASCCPMRPGSRGVVEDHADLARILAMMFHSGCGGLRCCHNLHSRHNHHSRYSHVTAASMSTAGIYTFEIRDLSLMACCHAGRQCLVGLVVPCRPPSRTLRGASGICA